MRDLPEALWATAFDPNVEGLILSETPILCNLNKDDELNPYFSGFCGPEEDKHRHHVVIDHSHVTDNALRGELQDGVVTIEDGGMGEGVVVIASLDWRVIENVIKGARGILTAVKARIAIFTKR